MKAAFFSDVHGNWDALQAFLKATESADLRVFCGDAVGYGDQPNECCEALRQLGFPAVLGNHDAFAIERLSFDPSKEELYKAYWTQSVLSNENKDWLRSLPDSQRLDWQGWRFMVHHASPWDLETYLYPDSPRLADAEQDDGSTLVVGHTHRSLVRPGTKGTIVNCGSVGFPRSGPPGAHYMAFDSETGSWTFGCAAYDVAQSVARMREQGWSEIVLQRMIKP